MRVAIYLFVFGFISIVVLVIYLQWKYASYRKYSHEKILYILMEFFYILGLLIVAKNIAVSGLGGDEYYLLSESTVIIVTIISWLMMFNVFIIEDGDLLGNAIEILGCCLWATFVLFTVPYIRAFEKFWTFLFGLL